VLRRYFSGGGGGSTGSSAAKATLSKVFDHYREDPKGEPDAVGVEGTMKYFTDIDVDLNGLDSFATHEIVQAPAMGELTREGFVNGWQERK
jgi:DCN1-like protein 1/2